MPIAQHTSHSLVFVDAAAADAAAADAVVATKRRSPRAKCKENETKKGATMEFNSSRATIAHHLQNSILNFHGVKTDERKRMR